MSEEMLNPPAEIVVARTGAASAKLGELGKSPAELRTLKLQRVAKFLSEFRWATKEEIRRVAQVKVRGVAEQLVRDGILLKWNSGRFGNVYTLAPKGQDYLSESSPYYKYEPRSGDVTLNHSHAVKTVVLDALEYGYAVDYKGERGVQSLNMEKRPDALLVRWDGCEVPVEVELSPKKKGELDSFISFCLLHYSRYGYAAVLIAFESTSLMLTMQKNLQKARIEIFEKARRSHTVEDLGPHNSIPLGIDDVFIGKVGEWKSFESYLGYSLQEVTEIYDAFALIY